MESLACIMEAHSTKEPRGESLYQMERKFCYADSYLLIDLCERLGFRALSLKTERTCVSLLPPLTVG